MKDEQKQTTEDILDLCRINLMEEQLSKSPATDRDETMAAIDWKRRHLVTRIRNDPLPVTSETMERHRTANTAADGTYPWTESPRITCDSHATDSANGEAKGPRATDEQIRQYVEECRTIVRVSDAHEEALVLMKRRLDKGFFEAAKRVHDGLLTSWLT